MDIRPARQIRTEGRVLAPEGFFHFIQSIGMAETEVGKIPPIELSQQASRPSAFKTLPELL